MPCHCRGGTESTYAADTTAYEHVTLTVANEGENKPLTSFIGAGVYEPGQKAKIESKKGAKEFYGFWEIKSDDSGLYEKKFADETLETNMLADRELVPDCADHYNVHYSGINVCTGNGGSFYYSSDLSYTSNGIYPSNGNYNYYISSYAAGSQNTASGIISAGSLGSFTRCMNSAASTSKSGYYRINNNTLNGYYYIITDGSVQYGNNDRNHEYVFTNQRNRINNYGYQTQGGTPSYSPSSIPAGTRGNKTVNVS